jgi:hypothetical protein
MLTTRTPFERRASFISCHAGRSIVSIAPLTLIPVLMRDAVAIRRCVGFNRRALPRKAISTNLSFATYSEVCECLVAQRSRPEAELSLPHDIALVEVRSTWGSNFAMLHSLWKNCGIGSELGLQLSSPKEAPWTSLRNGCWLSSVFP